MKDERHLISEMVRMGNMDRLTLANHLKLMLKISDRTRYYPKKDQDSFNRLIDKSAQILKKKAKWKTSVYTKAQIEKMAHIVSKWR